MPSRLLIALIATFAVTFTTLAQAGSYGRTQGSFSVTPNGASQYSIPIWAPPGPKSIQPGVALTYNSQNGIGPLGIGWSLTGLGAVTRCNRTYAQDTTPAPVALASSDGYCINGNRLRLVSGTYGAAASTYQTEVADFSKVTANGGSGSPSTGPESFTVQAKNGLTYEYGSTDGNGNGANSAVLATGTTTVSQWLLSKVIDRAGNNLVINYTTESGTAVPNTILWTPTVYQASTYLYKMQFNYGTNAPQSSLSAYIGGTAATDSALLTSIEILVSNTVVKDYFLAYEASPTTGRDELKSVTECADSAESNCLLPTSITYQNGALGVSTTATTAVSSTGLDLRTRYDLNGDGYLDLVYQNSAGITTVAFGSASGYGTPVSTGVSAALIGNVTGGKEDGLLVENGGTWYYYLWNGSSFTGASTGLRVDSASSGFQLADINGDGLPDLIDLDITTSTTKVGTTASATVSAYLNTSTGGVASFSSTAAGSYNTGKINTAQLVTPDLQYGALRRYDFNGDGRDDLALMTVTGTSPNYTLNTYELISTGSGFNPTLVSSGSGSTFTPVFFTNWNDDACTDFVANNALYISGCNGTVETAQAFPSTVIGAIDWNGDGRTDLLVANGATIGVYLATGALAGTVLDTTIPYSSACQYVTMDANGDGLDDLGCWNQSASGPVTYYSHDGAGQLPDLVSEIADGYGNYAKPTYVSLVQGAYTNASDATFPYQNTIAPMYVTNAVTFSDASNLATGTYTRSYSYTGAWMNLQGRGFSGFGSMQAVDSRNALWETVSYDRSFPYSGMVSSDIVSQNSANTLPIKKTTNALLSSTLIATANNESYFPYVTTSTTLAYEVGGSKNGQLITTSETNYGMPSDNYGNFDTVTSVLTDNDSGSPYYNDTWTSSTVNTIAADPTTWCLSLPTETTVTNSSTAPNGGAITRTVTYPNPDYTNCRETEKVTAPGTAYQVTEVYGYDTTFGNLLTDAVTGLNVPQNIAMPTRTTTLTWNGTGQFPATVENALGQTITLTFDPNSGMKISQTDPNWTKTNPLTTTWTPDPFFRVSSQTNLDGTSTTWTYNDCATAGCVNANNRMTVTQTTVNTDGSTQRVANTYTDSLGRTLVTSKQMLNGAYDRNEVQYDSLGRVHLQGAPCTYVSCATYWTTNTYDVLNRITESERPISATNSTLQSTIYGYAGRTATVKDPLGNTRTLISLVNGALARTTDPKGYSVNFSYDAFGSRVATTDSASPANTLSTAAYSYGLKAFKTASTDMDRGSRSYTVDPLGEVTAYTDAKGQSFSITYDALSRKLVRTEPDLTTTWTWGNTASSYNIGKLAQVTAASSAGTWSDTYTYDSLTRYSSETISNPGDRTYEYVKTYSPTTGLPASLQYPVDISFVLTVQYAYSYGILQSVSSNSFSPTVTYWTANTTNPRGQVTQETLGNGVVKTASFDAVTGWLTSIQAGAGGGSTLQNNSFSYDYDGDLIQRQDNNQGLTEDYYYDTLNRLDHTTLNGALNLQMEYDTTGMGNIASRSDVAGGAAWTYDPVRKHAVTQAGSSAYTYAYDANGNASSRNGYPITWTSYNLPTGISTATESVQFAYDANRQRWQEIYTGGPNGTETTYYAGKLFEVDNYGGLAHYRHFVYAGNELVSIDDRTTVSTPQYFVVADHQGSYLSILTSNTSADESCPAGYTLSGSSCTETLSQAATTNYSCPAGYTLSGSSCVDTSSVAATVNYSCPAGYSLSGSTCSELVSVAATLNYSCPSGYSLSGTTCSETESEAATWVCPPGGGKPEVAGASPLATCPNGATGHYTCPSGWSLSGNMCYQTLTQAATSSYSCPAGYALSGTTCSETLTQAATASYSCPAGYTLSGTTCSETLTVAASISYSCPTGYTLSGSTCNETLSVAPTGSAQSVFVPESFTPFGNRRNGETWYGAPTTSDADAIDSVSRRGYTGESGLGISMGLNHLNGRVEDAITGRFLSPDPMTGDATNTQGYNRYSYAENNPATFTDPSGMTVCKGKGPACQGCADYCMAVSRIGTLGIGNAGDGAFEWMDATDFTGVNGYNAQNASSYQDLGNGFVGIPEDSGDDGLSPIVVTATYQTDPTAGAAQSGCSVCLTQVSSNQGVPVALPGGANIADPTSPTGLLMSPVSDLSDVAAAGYGLRSFMNTINDPNADPDQVTAALVGLAVGLGVDVGQGGLYDYQRQGNLLTGFTQQPQFRDVSNFNVGLVGQQAGMSLPQLLTVAGGFAQGFSSNYSPSQPYGLAPQTYAWIVTGWTVGNLGYFGH